MAASVNTYEQLFLLLEMTDSMVVFIVNVILHSWNANRQKALYNFFVYALTHSSIRSKTDIKKETKIRKIFFQAITQLVHIFSFIKDIKGKINEKNILMISSNRRICVISCNTNMGFKKQLNAYHKSLKG